MEESTIGGITASTYVPSSLTNTEDIASYESPSRSPLKRFISWYNEKPLGMKIVLMITPYLLLIIIICAGIFYWNNQKTIVKITTKITSTPTQSITPTVKPTPSIFADPLTGVNFPIDQQGNLTRAPLAAMIENSIPARPQTGLSSADIVYETNAEGGITRFMAVFLGNIPKLIGPIRSARTYFLDWQAEYKAVYVHWGQNSDVQPLLAPDNVKNLDAMMEAGSDQICGKNTDVFCRDTSRVAPHNGYGYPDRMLSDAASHLWNDRTPITSWQFKDDAAIASRGIQGKSLSISFLPNDPLYVATWVYDQNANQYDRYDQGVLQIDRLNNAPITAKNIVIQFVNGSVYTSSGGKDVYGYKNIGTGKASIFMDGKQIDGMWKKDSLASRTLFSDTQGNPITFNKGRSWITVLVNGQGNFTLN